MACMAQIRRYNLLMRCNSQRAKRGFMLTFSCGHTDVEPRNMGRGAARAKRLQAHFARPCYACACTHAESFARSLTRLNGLTLDQMIDKQVKRIVCY